jgi:hypothetical protein
MTSQRTRPAFLLGGVLLLVGVAVLPAQTGGTSPYESVLKDLVAALDGLTKILVNVRDESAAKAAVPEVKKAVGRLTEVQKKAQALPQPDKAEKDRVARLYGSKLQESIHKLFTEIARVKAIPGGSELAVLIKPAQTRNKSP